MRRGLRSRVCQSCLKTVECAEVTKTVNRRPNVPSLYPTQEIVSNPSRLSVSACVDPSYFIISVCLATSSNPHLLRPAAAALCGWHCVIDRLLAYDAPAQLMIDALIMTCCRSWWLACTSRATERTFSDTMKPSICSEWLQRCCVLTVHFHIS